ncbi:MAG TPA: HPF/RaiA family ribosome-associated protein [Burkholderiales bacterium]|nr:HPF/RaiA family ribosome-associated protein [Burkholderiales bacterium]
METPPQIIFHDVDRSDWIEAYVGERLRHLERFAQGITRCHVTLTREQSSRHTGNRYSVMVEVRLPPQHDLAAKKQKEIIDMDTQLPALINLAFGAIERQLKKTAALRRGDEKTHADEAQPHGVVEKLFGEGYGFIRTLQDDRQFYFHRNSVLHDDFERLTVGTEVRFTAELGEQGPQASSVQVIGKPGSAAAAS